MSTMTIKNISGRTMYFGYGDASVESTASFGVNGIAPAFKLANNATKSGLPYSLSANPQFIKDLNAGLIEITVGTPIIRITNESGLNAYFGYTPPTYFLADDSTGPEVSLSSGLAGVRGLANEIADAGSPLAKDIAAGDAVLVNAVTVTVSAVANGTVSPTAGAHVVGMADDFRLTMTPSAHYHINTFTDNSVDKKSSIVAGVYTLLDVQAAHTLTCTFTVDTFAITFALGTGTRTGGGALSQTVDYSVVPTLPTYTAAAGYRIADVPWSPVVAAATAIQTYTALYTKTWLVEFDLGTGTRTGGGALSQTIDNATAATAPTYTAAAGYRIADVPWDRAFTNITAATAVTALYTRFWVVAAVAGANGSVDVPTQNVDDGASSAPITATAHPHYHFTGWTGDYIGTVNPYTFTSVHAAKAVSAVFAIDTFEVTFDVAGGTRTGGGAINQTIDYAGSAIAPTITPPAGYRAADVPFDAPLTNITAIQTITALWTRTWQMTMAKDGTGTITPTAGAHTVDGGVAQAITASATNFVNWTATGGAVLANANSPATTVTLTANSTVTAHWSA